MTLRIARLFLLLATPAAAQGQADPTNFKVGEPSGAIRSLSNSSEGRSDSKQTTQVPAGSISEGQLHGAPVGTSARAKVSGRVRVVVRWLFKDRRTGRIVVGQDPNLLALLVVASYTARFVVPKAERAGPTLRKLGTFELSLWALDELLRGVNPFRRIGGVVVLATIATMAARSNGTRIVTSVDLRTSNSTDAHERHRVS